MTPDSRVVTAASRGMIRAPLPRGNLVEIETVVYLRQ